MNEPFVPRSPRPSLLWDPDEDERAYLQMQRFREALTLGKPFEPDPDGPNFVDILTGRPASAPDRSRALVLRSANGASTSAGEDRLSEVVNEKEPEAVPASREIPQLGTRVLRDAETAHFKPADQIAAETKTRSSVGGPPVSREQQHANVARAEEYLKHPSVRAFLDVIAEAEGAKYDSLHGINKTFSGYDHFPGKIPQQDEKGSSASGRYQIIGQTYKGLSRQLGLTDFSPRTQDLMAVQLLIETGAIKHIVTNDLDNALRAAYRVWTALPKSATEGNIDPTQPYSPHGKIKSDFDRFRLQHESR